MQVFATRKAIAMAVPKLTMLFTKYRHAVRVMKLTAILLLAACLHVSAWGVSQTITLSLKDAPIQKVFKEIERQTDYTFFVERQWLEKAKKVTIVANGLPLNQVLELCFKDQPFSYSISGKTITLGPKKEKVDKEQKTSAIQNPLIDIKGRVVNENNDPVDGVTVTVKGTSIGTTTNSNGEFFLKSVEENATLVFSSVNMEAHEVKVSGKNFLDVALQTKITSMQEVVINKGYYTEKKKFSTGNVSKVTSKEIEQQPVLNPLLALQGRVPGLFITQASGVPGAGVTVRIQGLNSIAGGSDPLYVIDGVPYPSQMLATTATTQVSAILGGSGSSFYSPGGNGNPLSYINPSDIESIEVLKDADATSIYGSRAANGAILITTKSGKVGPAKVDINLQQGWGKVTRSMNVMNTEQYVEMRKEAFANDNVSISPTGSDYDINGLWDQNRNTDWVKTLIGGTAKYTNINSSVSGGNASIQYLVGGTYQRETTVFPGNFSDQKGTLHFNINSTSSNKKFRLVLTGSYMVDNNQLPRNDYTGLAYTLPPNAPALYKDDGTLNWAPNLVGNSSWDNPLAQKYKIYQNKTDNLISSAILSYNLLKGLDISSRFGYTKLTTDEFATDLTPSQRPERRANYKRNAVYSNGVIKIFNIEPQINYKKTFGKGNFDALIGATIQQNNNDGQRITGVGFATDGLRDLASATTIVIGATTNAVYKYSAAFGRLNYTWKDKYIINLTARRDGSSRFGDENRFHNFASAGAAWIFSEEKFFQKSLRFLSFGKLKASYGTTGNDQIGDYSFLERYISNNPAVPYQGGSSINTNRITNPYLQWEETRKLSVGLDLSFINDRIALSAVYGRNRSSNQLLSYTLPIITGFSSIDRNFPATVQNTTWELSVISTNLKGKTIEWTTNINLTIPRNKLISFPNLETSSYKNSLVIGQPVSINKASIFLGVDPTTGLYTFAAANGLVTNNPDILNDPTKLINVDPKFYGGFQNNIRYKQFHLDALFQFISQTQKDAYRFGMGALPPGMDRVNQPLSVLNHWQKPGDNTSVQLYSENFSKAYNPYNKANFSDAAYVNASYIRLKNISISYDLSSGVMKRLRIKHCNIFLAGQNLLTITSFGGIEPETHSFVSLAPLKIYSAGLKLSF
ncbi:hypothetical protein A3860_38760 [Niastella vici]|uniref:TonB-dependent receptor plug domain-containing protein n=1 Tax=Niastella vici TaxID=1703345 RepID=A0A1V9FL57_9BACT|nr:SusC/RagA family TonB-linked outer membrane protein [Niastella vici]OQP59113.1 hypothetical protein A3860_38760 [Niastella vici]